MSIKHGFKFTDFFNGLLRVGDGLLGITTGRKVVQDSDGTTTPLELSSAEVVVNGKLTLIPGTDQAPTNNGEVTVELTDNATLTFHAKGSDGTVRSGAIELS